MTIINPTSISGINSITSGTQNRIAFYDVNGGTNLTFLVGSASSTGTASQPLQVTGGAYVSTRVGIASTNPTEVLHIVGNFNASGIVTGGIVATTTQMAGVTTTGITTSGVAAITLSGTNVTVSNGDFIVGSGIAPGTTVTSGGGTVNLVLSATVGLTTASNQITTYPAGKIVTSGVIGGQLCRAWVNFDGVNNGKIRAAYNVSSVTKNGTGDYTVNFTTALVDANYSISGTAARTGTTDQAGAGFTLTANDVVAARTSSACRLIVLVNAGDAAFDSPIDSAHVNVAIFR